MQCNISGCGAGPEIFFKGTQRDISNGHYKSSTRAVWSNLRVRNPRAAAIIRVAAICSSSVHLNGGL
jgi:hypothetical protein